MNDQSQREVMGWLDWASETESARKELFRILKTRGLGGIELVVSDAHEGLVKAVEESFLGAVWQECQTHFMHRALGLVRNADKSATHEDLRLLLLVASRERADEEKALVK